MKSLLNKFKWLRIIIGGVFVALGIVMLVLALSDKSADLTKTLCVILGIYCLLIGLFSTIVSLVVEAKTKLPVDLITGALFIGIGISIFIDLDATAGILTAVVTTCVPWVLIALGSVLIVKAIILLIVKGEVASWVLAAIAGAVALTLGIVLWVNREHLDDIIYSILAIVIIAVGALELIAGIIDTIKNKKSKTNDVVVTAEEPKQIK